MVPRLERIPFNVTRFLSRGNLLADCVPISQISRLGLNQHRQPIQFRGPREKAYGLAKYFAGGSLTFPGSGPKCKENRNWNNTKDNCVAAKKKSVKTAAANWQNDSATDELPRPTVLAKSGLLCGCCGRCGNKGACGNWFIQMKSQQEKQSQEGVVR